MTVLKKFKFWHDVFPHVTKRRKVRIRDVYGGQTIGVDADAMLWDYGTNHDNVIRAIGQRLSYYEPTKMMRAFERTHEVYLLQNITPIYVFGGQTNPVIRPSKAHELAYNRMHTFYTVHGRADLANPTPPRLVEYSMAASQIRRLRDVDPKVIRFMANWMQSVGCQVVGAPYEPHWQLVELERQGTTSGSICFHMNIVMSGGKHVLLNHNHLETMKGSVFSSQKDLCNPTWTFDFTKYIEYLPEFAALYGTIYNFRISGLTVQHLYKNHFRHMVEALRNGEDYWSSNYNADEKFTMEYKRACHQFRYGPVFRKSADDNNNNDHDVYTVEPLNPLPEGSSWKELMGYDPIATLTVDPADYQRAANFDGCTFVDETSQSPWYEGIFPKLRDINQDEEEKNDILDEDEEKPLDYLEMLKKERMRVPRPAPKVQEPEIVW